MTSENRPFDLQQAIARSHERSHMRGVNAHARSHTQCRLSEEELTKLYQENAVLLEVLWPHYMELQKLLAVDTFTVAVVDAQGYILHLGGKEDACIDSEKRNCAPGFRWKEEDVGTTAVSLCLLHKEPIQLKGTEHYCKLAHEYTSSAAPLFGKDNKLLGVLMVNGKCPYVHEHTLHLVVTAAQAIERELRILRRNKELDKQVHFLDQIVDSVRTGMLVLDNENTILQVNSRGCEILHNTQLVGKKSDVLEGMILDIPYIQRAPSKWINVKARITHADTCVDIIYTPTLVTTTDNTLLGVVVSFEAVGEITKIAESYTGTRAHYSFNHIIGESAALRSAMALAQRGSLLKCAILLQGETGTGKELFAQAIHNNCYKSGRPFVPINCGAIPAELLESELFGYAPGAFTGAAKGGRPGKFELANGGTILLDEIGDMPMPMQVKLLRVLQTGEVCRIGSNQSVHTTARVIASTHVDLKEAVRAGRFRKDLFYRLNVFPVQIPSLKERGSEDILLLARYFLTQLSTSMTMPLTFTKDAEDLLTSYHWPGNIRELENTIYRGMALADEGSICANMLHLPEKHTASHVWEPQSLKHVEQQAILATVQSVSGNLASAAKILGISRTTLYRRLHEYGYPVL